MSLVLGVDPGSRLTGFGLVQSLGAKLDYVTSGVIRIAPTLPLPERLDLIYESLIEVIEKHQPSEFAIESVFMSKSAGSALKLGQARGAAIVAATSQGLEVHEYEARKVKQSVVGTGAADKLQVQHMVKTLLKLPKTPQEDAADALAVALCHINTQKHLLSVAQSKHFRRGRLV